MHGLIIENAETLNLMYLKEVFAVIGDNVEKYNWMMSNYEIHSRSADSFRSAEYTWFNDENSITKACNENPYFYWGVATAYCKQILLDDVLKYELPYADCNRGFWSPDISMQNPLSDIEIVFWHGNLLLVFSKQKSIIEKFVKKYPQSLELVQYNMNRLDRVIERDLNNPNKVLVNYSMSFINDYNLEKYIRSDLYIKFKALYNQLNK